MAVITQASSIRARDVSEAKEFVIGEQFDLISTWVDSDDNPVAISDNTTFSSNWEFYTAAVTAGTVSRNDGTKAFTISNLTPFRFLEAGDTEFIYSKVLNATVLDQSAKPGQFVFRIPYDLVNIKNFAVHAADESTTLTAIVTVSKTDWVDGKKPDPLPTTAGEAVNYATDVVKQRVSRFLAIFRRARVLGDRYFGSM